ncbi:MAG: magnesium transporter CorA family protein [Deltaproteobacteria bacterium]
MRAYIIENASAQHFKLSHENIDYSKHYFIIMHESEFDLIGEKFDIKTCLNADHMDKKYNLGIETHNNYYTIALNIPRIVEGKVIVQPVVIYTGKNFLIISSNEETDLVKAVEGELLSSSDILLKGISNPSNKMLYLLFDRLVQKSLGVIRELERRIEAQEEKVLKVGKSVMVNELITMRRQVFKVRRYLNYLTYISDVLLLNENEIINDDMIKYFNNIDIKFAKLDSDISELYQFIASLREAYESETSNQLNQIMKVFTMISTIFLPLTLIAGIYGMNFDNMPELRYKYGYYSVMGFMALLSIGMLFYFRKKKWI